MKILNLVGSSLFTLSTLLSLGTTATPPAHAVEDNNCVLFALAGASRIPLPDVTEITGFMDGPDLGPAHVQEGLGILGVGTGDEQRFFTRQQLENYLTSSTRPNAEFIVGWRPVNANEGIGHVVNARVINGRIRYIDNQNQCESPNPAAEPPREGALIYFAWLTDSNVQPGVEDIGFLLGGLSLQDARNTSLAARSENAPLRNASFGNFTEHCRNINLSTNFNRSSQVSLSAECKDEQGNFQPTAIILDHSIVNESGALMWRSGGGFGRSVQNCRIDVDVYTVLTCDAGDGRGDYRKAAINLDAEIVNRNGKLTSNI